MKEKDIRDRINAFLRSRLQNLVVPASMGLGLALGACDTSALQTKPDSGGDASSIHPSAGGAGGGGGMAGAGGMVYGTGGGFGGMVTLYGFAGYGAGGAGGGPGGAGGMTYGYGGFPSSGGIGGGLGGAAGTVYGTGGFKDAGSAMPETGKSETGQNPDEQVSEAGVVEPTDSKPAPRDGLVN